MVLSLLKVGAAAAVAGAAYLIKKYHTVKAAVAAVKAEIAKIESEFTGGLAADEAKAKAVIARLKALL